MVACLSDPDARFEPFPWQIPFPGYILPFARKNAPSGSRIKQPVPHKMIDDRRQADYGNPVLW